MKTCSVLIPTRRRPAKLTRAIESVLSTTTRGKVEVLVGFDDDDELTPAIWDNYRKQQDVYFCKWPRQKEGYNKLSYYYDLLAIRSLSRWCLIFNDDATIQGNGWDTTLEGVPSSGFLCYPEAYTCGASRYLSCMTQNGGPFPMAPTGSWGVSMPNPVDIGLYVHLTPQGWKTRILNGMTIIHTREIDETLPRERF